MIEVQKGRQRKRHYSLKGKHLQVLVSHECYRGLLTSQATTNNHFPFKGITVCATVLYKLSPIMGRILCRCQDHSLLSVALSLSHSLSTDTNPNSSSLFSHSSDGNLSYQMCSLKSKLWRLRATATFVTSFHISFFLCSLSFFLLKKKSGLWIVLEFWVLWWFKQAETLEKAWQQIVFFYPIFFWLYFCCSFIVDLCHYLRNLLNELYRSTFEKNEHITVKQLINSFLRDVPDEQYSVRII